MVSIRRWCASWALPCCSGGTTEAFSFHVVTDDQAEADRLWNAICGPDYAATASFAGSNAKLW